MPHDDISSSPDKTVHRTKTKNGVWVRMGNREQRPAELRKMGGGAVRQMDPSATWGEHLKSKGQRRRDSLGLHAERSYCVWLSSAKTMPAWFL
jgi:hypothetical protein